MKINGEAITRTILYVLVATSFEMMFGLGLVRAQAPGDKPSVVRLDPALDELISSDAKLQVAKDGIGEGDGFTEGTNWVQYGKTGYLLFSDIPGNVVYKLTLDGTLSVYLDRSGYTGPFNGHTLLTVGGSTENGPFVQLGTDGLTLDPQGRLILCAFGDRALERLEKDGKRTVLADSYEGKRFNGPNDAVVKKDGTIYFSDTFSGLRSAGPGLPKSLNKGLDQMYIFMIKDGKLSSAISDIKQTNGLAFSPDEKYLYANGGGANYIRRYDVQPDDTVTNGRLLIDLSVDKSAPGSTDGMRVDSRGNIYSTGPGGVWIISPEGTHLGTILTPKTVANLTFGDPDWKTVYMAAHSTIYKIRVNTPGLPCNSCSSK